ncbi:MAG: hypothetical protein ACRC5M_04100 [Anaeroplasmataceae bacterium]
MANTSFDFLTESFLFDERYIEDYFSKVSEKELESELERYRVHIRDNYIGIVDEIKNESKLNISIESLGELPNEQLLKQLALYMDKVIISDPVFEFTSKQSQMQGPMEKLMGIKSNSTIDKVKLVNMAKYMKKSTPLVASQFIKYAPISLIHEPPKQLPLLYSQDNFSNELSEEIYKFFYEKANISNVIIKDSKMSYREDSKLRPGTTIAVNFDSENIRKGHIYQYLETKIQSIDEKTGKLKIMHFIPDNISPKEFENWIINSINRAAISEFQTTFNEAVLAKQLNCMYMAKSQFTSELLSKKITKSSVTSDLANLSMKLDLPVLNKISIEDLVSIRNNNGQAFYNFRTDLNSKLLSLRGLTNKDELQRKLENISYEMNQTQVEQVNKEYRKIVKSLGVDALLLTGSLCTSFFTGGLTIIGAAGALAKGATDCVKYSNTVKENNGYFLWKLNR